MHKSTKTIKLNKGMFIVTQDEFEEFLLTYPNPLDTVSYSDALYFIDNSVNDIKTKEIAVAYRMYNESGDYVATDYRVRPYSVVYD